MNWVLGFNNKGESIIWECKFSRNPGEKLTGPSGNKYVIVSVGDRASCDAVKKYWIARKLYQSL